MSARHWSSAIWTQVEPAPSTVGPAASVVWVPIPSSAAQVSTAHAPVAMAARPRPRNSRTRLPEPPVDVIGRPLVVGVLEDLLRRPHLDDLSRRALFDHEECAAVRHSLSLLHVVGADHD